MCLGNPGIPGCRAGVHISWAQDKIISTPPLLDGDYCLSWNPLSGLDLDQHLWLSPSDAGPSWIECHRPHWGDSIPEVTAPHSMTPSVSLHLRDELSGEEAAE